MTKVVCTEGDYGWAVVQPGELQWEEAREHRQGGRDISVICNTSHSRWTYHKARRKVAITHNVVSSSQCWATGTKAWILNWNSLTRCNEIAWIPSASSSLHHCIGTMVLPDTMGKAREDVEDASRSSIFLERIWNEMRLPVCNGTVLVILERTKLGQDLWIQFREF